MRKLLLTLAASAVIAPSFAQSSSIVLTEKASTGEIAEIGSLRNFNNPSGNKTTAVGGTSWYYMPGIMSSSQSKLYYNVNYPDSNVTYTGTSGTVHVFMHGMGHSFDPTDSAFYSEATSMGALQDPNGLPAIRVTSGNAYTIDSISFLGKYMRSTNNDDTLIIQVAKTARNNNPVFGLYGLTFQTSGEHFGSALYDKTTGLMSDSIPSGNVQTMKIVLDAAFAADTATSGGGRSNRTAVGFQLPSPLNLNANEIALVYAYFKSSVNHPFGTTVANANTFRMYTWDFRGTDAEPIQNKNSWEAGLVATNQLKYYPGTTGFNTSGHQILIPHVAYTSEGLYTDFAFRVTCATCPTLGVTDVVGNIVTANAFPNPATDEVRIPFTLKAAADVTVTLTNTVGQVVASQNMGNTAKGEATLSVANLANGIYFFVVDAAGQTKTGRIVVSH